MNKRLGDYGDYLHVKIVGIIAVNIVKSVVKKMHPELLRLGSNNKYIIINYENSS